MRPGIVIVALWLGWLISWLLAALWSNQTERRPAIGIKIRYRIPMMFGMLLMFAPAHGYEGPLRLWHIGRYGAWLCVAGVAIGIGVAYFAHRAGYSYAEIADHMNISRITIKRHMARALSAIMEHGEL